MLMVMLDGGLGSVTKFRWSAWLGAPWARKAVRDVCYQLLDINYFYSHQ